jgi:hypothetical protein
MSKFYLFHPFPKPCSQKDNVILFTLTEVTAIILVENLNTTVIFYGDVVIKRQLLKCHRTVILLCFPYKVI